LEHCGKRRVLALKRDRWVPTEGAVDGSGLDAHRQNAPPARVFSFFTRTRQKDPPLKKTKNSGKTWKSHKRRKDIQKNIDPLGRGCGCANVKSQQLGSITQIAFSRLQAKRCGSNLDLDQSTAFSTASACSPLLAFCTMRGQESAARERLFFSCARVLN
jgi:hypothetical protein